eukprot:1642601-Rhodomonas_salina.4
MSGTNLPSYPICLGESYAMSSTDHAYAATRSLNALTRLTGLKRLNLSLNDLTNSQYWHSVWWGVEVTSSQDWHSVFWDLDLINSRTDLAHGGISSNFLDGETATALGSMPNLVQNATLAVRQVRHWYQAGPLPTGYGAMQYPVLSEAKLLPGTALYFRCTLYPPSRYH